jgi:hypothetical protein
MCMKQKYFARLAATMAKVLFVFAVILAGMNAVADPKPEYFIDESKLPFDPLSGATAYWGIHNKAGYRVEVPDNWNGDLVIWAHGFRGDNPELTVDNHPLRALLIAKGYAWAASSYSRNGYDVTTGVQDSHALAQRFRGLVGKPNRVYLTGGSMGGHIIAVAIEQYPKAFDGALSACGIVGDAELMDYYLDFSVAAQQLGTGFSEFPVDPGPFFSVTVPEIKANLEAAPGEWPVSLNTEGLNLKNLTELRSGGVRPNFDEGWFFWNMIVEDFLFGLAASDSNFPRAPGMAAENIEVVYQFDTDPNVSTEEEALNASIVRIEADPQARNPNGLSQVPVISGDISIPVLTLHNLGDLFVPIHNEIVYASRVSAHGKSDLLVQRAIRGVNHCDFTAEEFSQAFLDLVNWVETGAKPAGDNFLDPAAVADDSFGCTFTDGPHLFGTPCP